MCAGSAAGVIVGGEGAANGAGAIAGAGFVAAEPAFEAVVSTLPLRSVVAYEARLTSKGRGALKATLLISTKGWRVGAIPRGAVRSADRPGRDCPTLHVLTRGPGADPATTESSRTR